jgi:hypothetical protein
MSCVQCHFTVDDHGEGHHAKGCPVLRDSSSWEKFSAKEWALALQSLTPCGSEFLTPQECAEYVRKRTAYPRMVIELREALGGMLAAYAPQADWAQPKTLHSAVLLAGKLLGKL